MIYFFTGTPGSGKTYEAVCMILDELKKGTRVYTNIDGMEHPDCQETLRVLAGLGLYEFDQQFHHLGFDKSVIQNFWDHCEKNSMIVIDEVQKFFSNRNWASDENCKFGDWASTHRHDGYNLVIITQAAARVDSAVRDLTEWNYVFRKINFFGGAVQKRYLCNVFAGSDTSGQPIKRDIRHYSAKIFPCYKSYVSDDIKEQTILPNINILKHPVFLAIPIVLGFCIYMVFFRSSLGSGDIFGTDKIQEQAMSAITPEEAHASILPAAAQNNLVSGSSVPAQPPSDPLPDGPSVRVKLNYLEIHRYGQVSQRIIFDGQVYTANDFPYPITRRGLDLYAEVPDVVFESYNN